MKLLYIANVRMPTEKAHGVAIARACESFALAGVETTLVVPKRRTPFEKDVFETYGVNQVFKIEFLSTIDLIREKAGRTAFVLQACTFYLNLYLYLRKRDRSTVLYTRDPEALFFSHLGYKVVFECHLIPRNRDRFFIKAKRAHRVVVISQALKKAFVEAGFEPDSILVAPSGVDLSVFDIDATKEYARKMLDLPQERFIAVYTGNFTTMGHDKGISDILKALKTSPEMLFVAVGGSDKDRGRYIQEASDLGVLGQVVLRGSASQKILALYQKAADVLMMPFPDTPHYRNHMSPVKMFEYMAARRPIIASDLPTIREVLNETSAVIVPPDSPEGISLGFTRARQAANDLIEQAFSDVSQFSWQARTQKIIDHISKS